MNRLISAVPAALALAACARGPKPVPPPPVVAIAPAPSLPIAPEGGNPAVYRNPRIATVYLRAHVDAQGRLLGPQVMYEVADPGGWNVAALDSDAPVTMSAPGARPMTSSVRAEAPVAKAEAAPASPLVNPALAARVRFTGLMAESDRTAAETEAARSGAQAMFDPEAGWLLVEPAQGAQPAASK